MPFKSVKQRNFLFMKHPEVAKRWVAEYGSKVRPAAKKVKKRRKG